MFRPLRPVLGALALAGMPLSAMGDTGACQPLPNDLRFCPQDSAWQSARRIDLGGAIAFETGTHWLEIFDISEFGFDGLSHDAALDAIEAEGAEDAEGEGFEPPVFLGRESMNTAEFEATASLAQVDMGGGDFETMITVLVDAPGGRVLVSLDPGEDIAPDTLLEQTRTVLDWLRPANGG